MFGRAGVTFSLGVAVGIYVAQTYKDVPHMETLAKEAVDRVRAFDQAQRKSTPPQSQGQQGA